MPEFILAYHGGRKPESPEEGAQMMERWKTWLADLGDAMVNPGTPLGMSKFVDSNGVADAGNYEPLTGYSVVSAEDMDKALALAKSCPFVEIGTIEVAEMKKM